MSYARQLDHELLRLHTAKEDAFWAARMGLASARPGAFEEAEIALKQWTTDPAKLEPIRAELQRGDLGADERLVLEGWLHFFEVNAVEGEQAQTLQRRIIELEGSYESRRAKHRTRYTDPDSGEPVEASSNRLRLLLATADDEATRRAAFAGLRELEHFNLGEEGFVDMVRLRNRFARALGHDNFYAWKIQVSEGMSLDQLFDLLDELAERTADPARRAVDRVRAEHGEQAITPWNFEHVTGGDLTAELDPYLRFEGALGHWARSYTALGIRYRGATLSLDLVERQGKYENGFMHGPELCWLEDGQRWHPARINFTANAVPGQLGSGARALGTLFHEGGHAAQFSNIVMPSPVFSTEFSPTSIAFAETQSMFLDSLIDDPDWLARYPKNEQGEAIPEELILRHVAEKQFLRAWQLRKMMIVPFFEREVYQLPDEELSAERILEIGRRIEAEMTLLDGGDARPILAVPHLMNNESSAYYHAYVLALMAVDQTRAFFLARDGQLTDNPAIGPDLAEHYWKRGNSVPFHVYIQELTGSPFRPDAAAERAALSSEDAVQAAKADIERAASLPPASGQIDLDAEVRMVHGDVVIGSASSGEEFAELERSYAAWLARQEEQA